jgi:hypothetical protein
MKGSVTVFANAHGKHKTSQLGLSPQKSVIFLFFGARILLPELLRSLTWYSTLHLADFITELNGIISLHLTGVR